MYRKFIIITVVLVVVVGLAVTAHLLNLANLVQGLNPHAIR
jgi:hypothetical protein